MMICSSFGEFCVVADPNKSDGLLMQSKSKIFLNRLFDEKRINPTISGEYDYYVAMCKQEFAHTMIVLIKDINYPEFAGPELVKTAVLA